MPKDIDFTNPFLARKWLMLLHEHSKYGYVLPKKINFDSTYMGFDFYTNSLGLRGPEDLTSGLVVMGTSFAMGFSVNRGENWYEQSSTFNPYLNLGMPVGLKQLGLRLTGLRIKSYDQLILMYHPNMLTFTSAFKRASNRKQSLFEYFKWKTDYFSCFKLMVQKKIKSLGSSSKFIYCDQEDVKYRLDKTYCLMNREDHQVVWQQVEEFLKSIFPLFKRVEVIRCKVKEEVAAEKGISKMEELRHSHQLTWNSFKTKCESYQNTNFHEPNNLELVDFMPLDTHWSASGNKKFSDYLELKRLV